MKQLLPILSHHSYCAFAGGAVSLDPHEATYYSNRQACLFDMGAYAASIQDGRVAETLFRDKMRVGLTSRHDVEVRWPWQYQCVMWLMAW